MPEALSLNHSQAQAGRRRWLGRALCPHSHTPVPRETPAAWAAPSLSKDQRCSRCTTRGRQHQRPHKVWPSVAVDGCSAASAPGNAPIIFCGFCVFLFPTSCGRVRQWQPEQLPPRLLLVPSPRDKPTASPRASAKAATETLEQGEGSPCPEDTTNRESELTPVANLHLTVDIIKQGRGTRGKKILSRSSPLLPHFTCLSPPSPSLLRMSLSTKSASLRHHDYGPGGEGWRLSQPCMHRSLTPLYTGRDRLHWVRTAQGLLSFTHSNVYEFTNSSPEELKLQVRLVPLNPFPPATRPFPYYIASKMQNWYQSTYARSLGKPRCWGRPQVCTERIGFAGMGNHSGSSADFFSWWSFPQLPSGSLGKIVTQPG